MKTRLKRLIPLVLVFMMLVSSISFASPINVYVNDGKLDMPVEPVAKEGRTLVPLRSIFESMGASVDWNQASQTVTGVKDNRVIKLQLGNKIASINGENVTLDVPATAVNGSTLVPTRFVGESLGSKVDWDKNTRSVLVDSKYPHGRYKVTRVVDGDTIKVNFNGKEESLRFIGMDTPESVHPDSSKNGPLGKIASDYTRSMLEGKEIAIEFDVGERDHYGRLLGYVWVDGHMLNKTLVEKGYAKMATYQPNVRYVDDFKTLQEDARKNNRGFWKDGFNNSNAKPEVKPNPNPQGQGNFVISVSGKRYHKPGCRTVNKVKQKVTRQQASQMGYTPCGVCKP